MVVILFTKTQTKLLKIVLQDKARFIVTEFKNHLQIIVWISLRVMQMLVKKFGNYSSL